MIEAFAGIMRSLRISVVVLPVVSFTAQFRWLTWIDNDSAY